MTAPRPAPSDQPPARSSLVVGLGVGGLCLLSLLMVLLGLRELRFEQLRSGERAVMSLAMVTEEVVARTLQIVDTELVDLARVWRGGAAVPPAAGDWMHGPLRERASQLRYVRAIWLMDREGRIVHDSDTGNLGVLLGDRDYFRAHRDTDRTGVFIGNAVRSRTNGTWFVSVSRALRSADGRFEGVIVAALEPSYFATRWQSLDIGEDGSISVFLSTGQLLVRSPAAEALLGESFATDTMFTTPLPAGGRTEVRASGIDQVRRVFAARPVADYQQLVLAVGRSTDNVLQPWRRFALLALGGWLFASLLLGGLGWLLARELRRRQQSERDLRESEAQRHFALVAAGVGDWSMDLRTNVATRSLGHDRCFGYSEPVAAWGYDTFLSHVHPDDRERVNAAFQAAMGGDGDYDVEFRVVWPDGSLHWLWSKGRFAIDADGKPYNVAGIQVDITRRHLEAEALRRSERRYALLFRNSLDGILQTLPDGSILAANPAACAMFGRNEAELVAGGRAAVVDRNDPRLAGLLRARERDGAARGEMSMLRADGSRFEAEVSSVVYDLDTDGAATSLFVRDITERQRAEVRTQQQLARLELLRETTRAITLRLSLTTLLDELVSRLQLRMPATLAGVALYDADRRHAELASLTVDPDHAGCALATGTRVPVDANGLSRCLRGELVHEADLAGLEFELPRRLLAGGMRSAVLAPLALDGEVFGLILVARAEPQAFSSGDCEFLHQLSEHVALAAHQARLYEDLQQAYEQLQRSQQVVLQQERLRALGQMASGVAHDINNAVSPVALYTEALLDTEPDLSERTRRYLQTIQRAIDDVTHTVTRMREFSRERDPAAGLVAVQLNTLVPQVLELTRARWRDMPQQAGIAIKADSSLQPELPTVLATEGEIREALTNLVFNAVDAMPQGGGLHLGTAAHVGPDGQAEVALSVTDSGQGMDETTRRRCLEPFFTTKGERGTGLGLAMVYGTVQRHGGRIEIDSAPGQGTTVRLLFPVQAPKLAAALPAATAPVPAPTLRMLLIDDDALLLDSLSEILRGEGHAVHAALGGEAGIDALRQAAQSGERFNVVITDLGMPNVDGTEVAREAKALSPATAVVMLTGWGRRMSADDERSEHVDLLLSKPPRLAELRAMARTFSSSPIGARG